MRLTTMNPFSSNAFFCSLLRYTPHSLRFARFELRALTNRTGRAMQQLVSQLVLLVLVRLQPCDHSGNLLV